MGCLFNLIIFAFDSVLELILDGWFSLMQWIVPGRGNRIVLRIVVGIFSFALLITFTIGILAAAFTDATVFNLWKLVFIPLGISLMQIILGIIVRMIHKSGKRHS